MFIKKKRLTDYDTYVFIDVSNIRAATLKTCGFQIDFIALANYFYSKYPKLKMLNYYEGLAKNDMRKNVILDKLELSGYNIKTLERKAYVKKPIRKSFICKKCKYKNIVTVMPKSIMLKSNVDVYLASEMLKIALTTKRLKHLVIVSCDGDYAEAIRIATENRKVFVTVMATPAAKDLNRNTLSSRLKELCKDILKQYKLFNINDIKDKIITKNEDDPESASSRVGNTSPVT